MTLARLTPALLLHAYANGIFPMASGRHGGEIRWYAPDPRAIIDLEVFAPGRHFRKLMRSHPFRIRVNSDFRGVMQACAEPRDFERETWISPELVDAYCALHRMGFAHSVETWHEGRLVGGLYLVQVGAAAMGESMFSKATDASKVALLFLIDRLQSRGFRLLDTQFITPHLLRFGAIEISRDDYQTRLADALAVSPPPLFIGEPMDVSAPNPQAVRKSKPV